MGWLKFLADCAINDKNPIDELTNRVRRRAARSIDHYNDDTVYSYTRSYTNSYTRNSNHNRRVEIIWGSDDSNEPDYPPDLEQLVKECEIYIDTCSIMEPQFEKFAMLVDPFLKKYNKRIVVLDVCLDELKKHSSNTGDIEKYNAACKGVLILKRLDKEKLIKIQYTGEETFADPEFLALFTKKKIKTPIFFITQDQGLASDIVDLNDLESVKGYDISVCSIDMKGKLEWNGYDYYDDDDDDDE